MNIWVIIHQYERCGSTNFELIKAFAYQERALLFLKNFNLVNKKCEVPGYAPNDFYYLEEVEADDELKIGDKVYIIIQDWSKDYDTKFALIRAFANIHRAAEVSIKLNDLFHSEDDTIGDIDYYLNYCNIDLILEGGLKNKDELLLELVRQIPTGGLIENISVAFIVKYNHGSLGETGNSAGDLFGGGADSFEVHSKFFSLHEALEELATNQIYEYQGVRVWVGRDAKRSSDELESENNKPFILK